MRINPSPALLLLIGLFGQRIVAHTASGLRVQENDAGPNYKLESDGVPLYSAMESGLLPLAHLHDAYTTLVHPAFPAHAVRIRRIDPAFCDSSVRAYSGYVDVSGARHLFFQYFESRRDPAADDVVLWLNGGPGASATLGMLMELGPCLVDGANATRYNPYGWNDRANLLFVDQPAGVGYSYTEYGETVYSTAAAAVDIARFLALLTNSLAGLQGKPLHIAGESYGGRYVPWFAAATLDLNRDLAKQGLVDVNLKSIMIGDGDTDNISNLLAMYDMQCTSASGMMPQQSIENCVRMKQALPRCERMFRAACVDAFDSMNCEAAITFCRHELVAPWDATGRSVYDMSRECEGDVLDTLCYPVTKNITALMNQPWVRAALGVEATNITYATVSWAVNGGFGEADLMRSALGYLEGVLLRGVRVLIYAGTYDLTCNWAGNEQLALKLEWEGQEAFAQAGRRAWEVEGERAGEVRQVGRLAFVTIDGAGHMVPYDKPEAALQMLNRWLEDEPF